MEEGKVIEEHTREVIFNLLTYFSKNEICSVNEHVKNYYSDRGKLTFEGENNTRSSIRSTILITVLLLYTVYCWTVYCWIPYYCRPNYTRSILLVFRRRKHRLDRLLLPQIRREKKIKQNLLLTIILSLSLIL